MQLGVFYEIPVPRPWTERSELEAYAQTVDQAVAAEAAGFHSFWTVEHHFLEEFSHCSAPEVLYGYVAARTQRIRIGHGVRLLPFSYNHPVRVAEQAATLDLLSGGRVEFGVGRSATRVELEGFGVDPERTREETVEALRLVVRAWTEEELAWPRAPLAMPARRVVPRPLQKPHPPLWMAASSLESHALAGHLGVGLLSLTVGEAPEQLHERFASYRGGLAQARPVGRARNARVGTFTLVHCAETDERAEAEAAAAVEWYVRRGHELATSLARWQVERQRDFAGYEYTRRLDAQAPPMDFATLRRTGACLVGSPATCLGVARRYAAAGCDELLCLVQPRDIPHESVLRSIALLGRHVIPALRSG